MASVRRAMARGGGSSPAGTTATLKGPRNQGHHIVWIGFSILKIGYIESLALYFRVDARIIPRTTLITPGYLDSYDLHALEVRNITIMVLTPLSGSRDHAGQDGEKCFQGKVQIKQKL